MVQTWRTPSRQMRVFGGNGRPLPSIRNLIFDPLGPETGTANGRTAWLIDERDGLAGIAVSVWPGSAAPGVSADAKAADNRSDFGGQDRAAFSPANQQPDETGLLTVVDRVADRAAGPGADAPGRIERAAHGLAPADDHGGAVGEDLAPGDRPGAESRHRHGQRDAAGGIRTGPPGITGQAVRGGAADGPEREAGQ